VNELLTGLSPRYDAACVLSTILGKNAACCPVLTLVSGDSVRGNVPYVRAASSTQAIGEY
jgi:hypothetical protein